MQTYESVTVNLCTCCRLKLANDDTSGHEDSCKGEPEPMSALWADPSTVDVALGDGEPYFSWSQCDGCGSRLGGDRSEATLFFTADIHDFTGI